MVQKKSVFLCYIHYNEELADLFQGEEVIRAMVPLSVKWLGLESWEGFITNMLDAHNQSQWYTHCHPVLQCTADFRTTFERLDRDASRGGQLPQMTTLTATLVRRPRRRKKQSCR